MQKIKKIGPPKLDICTENAHFCDFLHFQHPEGEQPDFSVRQAIRRIKGLIFLHYCAKNQKNLMKRF